MKDINSPAEYRLTLEDWRQLPETFDSEDLRRVTSREGEMVVNTGLWICRLHQPWNKQINFEIRNGISWTTTNAERGSLAKTGASVCSCTSWVPRC
jgi:hypothetical protein